MFGQNNRKTVLLKVFGCDYIKSHRKSAKLEGIKQRKRY